MSIFDLTGKKAIVTGGSRGLGHGMAEGLLEAGCEVVIIGIRETIKDRADEFNQKGFKCTGVQADLGDEIALKEAFQESLAALGGHLDILVTAHGVQSRHPSEEFPMEDWKRVLDVNLTGKTVHGTGEQRKDYYSSIDAVILWRIYGTCICGIQRRCGSDYQSILQ